MVRIHTAAATIAGPCDHCGDGHEATLYLPEQVVTVVTLQRGDDVVFTSRFCERHFLLFSDLVSDQVAALLYPKR